MKYIFSLLAILFTSPICIGQSLHWTFPTSSDGALASGWTDPIITNWSAINATNTKATRAWGNAYTHDPSFANNNTVLTGNWPVGTAVNNVTSEAYFQIRITNQSAIAVQLDRIQITLKQGYYLETNSTTTPNGPRRIHIKSLAGNSFTSQSDEGNWLNNSTAVYTSPSNLPFNGFTTISSNFSSSNGTIPANGQLVIRIYGYSAEPIVRGGNSFSNLVVDDIQIFGLPTVLPVSFKQLEAQWIREDYIKLLAGFTTDEPVASLQLERKIGNAEWINLKQFDANTLGIYQDHLLTFLDRITETSASQFYYRWIASYPDGRKTYSKILFLQRQSNDLSIHLFPNPVIKGTNLNIQITSPAAGTGQVLVILPNGKQFNFYQSLQKGTQIITLPTDQLAKGMAIIQCRVQDKSVISRILIQ